MNCFYTGQQVACIKHPRDGYWRQRYSNGNIIKVPGPQLDEICVIRALDSSGQGLLFWGFKNDCRYADDTEVGFFYEHFRPLVDTKTDISIFTALLTSKSTRIDA